MEWQQRHGPVLAAPRHMAAPHCRHPTQAGGDPQSIWVKFVGDGVQLAGLCLEASLELAVAPGPPEAWGVSVVEYAAAAAGQEVCLGGRTMRCMWGNPALALPARGASATALGARTARGCARAEQGGPGAPLPPPPVATASCLCLCLRLLNAPLPGPFARRPRRSRRRPWACWRAGRRCAWRSRSSTRTATGARRGEGGLGRFTTYFLGGGGGGGRPRREVTTAASKLARGAC